MTHHHNIALLLAGGCGSRMGRDCPKQFMRVEGESVLLHTMRAFQHHPLVQDIYVVCADEWAATTRQEAEAGGIWKFRDTIEGGDTGFHSLRNGIRRLASLVDDPEAVVLVHDAVRPLITQDIISRNISTCLVHGNAITALASHEAFLVSQDGQTSTGFLPREGLLRAQTPHTFPLHTLQLIMDKADRLGVTHSQSLFTLANELGFVPLHMAEGDVLNFKLTVPQDILIYQALREASLSYPQGGKDCL